MVGLSVVLEGYNNKDINTTTSTWQILNKASMVLMKPTSPSSIPSSPFSPRKSPATSGFLDSCFLCKQKLLPGKDIYMYKGEWAFCSVDCRCKQIFMDEEDSIKTKSQASNSSSSNKSCTSSSSSSSSSSSRSRKMAARNRPNGFAY